MIKYIILLAWLLLFCVACEKKDSIFADFKNNEYLTIKDSIDLEQLNILNPYSIQYKDSFLVFHTIMGMKELYFLNLSSKHVTVHNVIGQGANEMPRYSTMHTYMRNAYRFANHRQKRIYEMNLEKLRKDSSTVHSLAYELPAKVKDDLLLRFFETNRYIFGIGLLHEGRIYSYDKKKLEVHVSMDYPEDEVISKLDIMRKGATYAGTMMEGNDTTLVLSCFGLLDFYTILPNGNLKLKCQRHYFFPPVSNQTSDKVISFNRNSLYGFSEIDSDEDFIYILYSGRNVAEEGEQAFNCPHLFVYDWNGYPMKHYKLSKPLYGFSLHGKTLYGLSREVEPMVYIYSLD